MPTASTRLAAAAILAVTLCACGADQYEAPDAAAPVVRDSVGVMVVHFPALPDDLPLWTIADEPVLSIGAIDGPGADVFNSVDRLVVRSDGAIVVADWVPGELRAFDATGSHLWTTGRIGNGPGEFAGMMGFSTVHLSLLPGDSLLAYDALGGRFQVFAPDGSYVRGLRLTTPAHVADDSRPSFVGTMADHRIVTRAVVEGTGVVDNAGYMSPTITFPLHDLDGIPLGEAGRFPGIARYREVFDGGLRSGSIRFGSDAVHAVAASGLAAGNQGRLAIHRYGLDGALEMILRVDMPTLPVDAEARARALEATVSGMPPARARRYRETYESSEFSDAFPAFGDLMLDSEARLWIGEYVLPWENRAATWWIFSPEGQALGRTTIPDGFTPFHVGADRMVGRWLDELRVSYVHVRPIIIPD
jgi:hypothetical protein